MHLLRSHIVFMHAEKRYQCPTCGERFSSKSFFNLHMLKENNEKNFVCDICSSRFFTTSHLKMHMKRHSEDKPFLCEVNGCGMRFKGKNIIKKHIHVVHLSKSKFKLLMTVKFMPFLRGKTLHLWRLQSKFFNKTPPERTFREGSSNGE